MAGVLIVTTVSASGQLRMFWIAWFGRCRGCRAMGVVMINDHVGHRRSGAGPEEQDEADDSEQQV